MSTAPSDTSQGGPAPSAFSGPETYVATLDAVPGPISTLLATYSHIPADEQKAHIVEFRDRAYKSHPYPCLGRWRFLELDLSGHPLYHSDILPALAGSGSGSGSSDSSGSSSSNDSETEKRWIFLDLGTCLGQDVRKLVFDGADPARVYGADLRPEFVEIGYALFRDEDRFPRDHFIAPADVFDPSAHTELGRKCDGRVGILHSCAVFHLFSLPEQRVMARRCLRLLDPRRKRVLICGSQIGNENPGDFPRRGGGVRYNHNTESWRQLWEGIAREDDWRDKIRSVDVDATVVGRRLANAGGDAAGLDRLTEAKKTFLGRLEKYEPGFRWMKWWVWVEFV